jgi:hypothetical protein
LGAFHLAGFRIAAMTKAFLVSLRHHPIGTPPRLHSTLW